MNLKLILSFITLFLFAFIGAGSVGKNGSLSGWVWVIIISFISVFVITAIREIQKENDRKKRAKAEAEHRKQQDAEKSKVFSDFTEQYYSEHGSPDKVIIIDRNDINGVIFVHEDKKEVFIKGKIYPFRDIISCTFIDSTTTIKGTVTAVTKSKLGSSIGRAVIGDAIAGPAGAIIGGTTGKKTTEFQQGSDRFIHNYTVLINLNSISTPIIRIETGDNGSLTNEIIALMNVIVSQK